MERYTHSLHRLLVLVIRVEVRGGNGKAHHHTKVNASGDSL